MKKKLFTCFYVILIMLTYHIQIHAKNNPDTTNVALKELVTKYSIKDNEYIAIVFIDMGSCIKCIYQPITIIINTAKISKKNIKIIGFVNCNRPKEIDKFSTSYNWNYYIEPDVNMKYRSRIGCYNENNICIINHSGVLVYQANTNDYNVDLQTHILNVLKE